MKSVAILTVILLSQISQANILLDCRMEAQKVGIKNGGKSGGTTSETAVVAEFSMDLKQNEAYPDNYTKFEKIYLRVTDMHDVKAGETSYKRIDDATTHQDIELAVAASIWTSKEHEKYNNFGLSLVKAKLNDVLLSIDADTRVKDFKEERSLSLMVINDVMGFPAGPIEVICKQR